MLLLYNNNIKMIEDFNDIYNKYDCSQNITNNILTKYEKVKVLGLRSEQIQRGAKLYVDIPENGVFNPLEIAKRELMEKKIPFMICRKLPNGQKEYWRLDDMIII
jgi:DNA-directed RNA polymerases I, II, and III subunit RPABC2